MSKKIVIFLLVILLVAVAASGFWAIKRANLRKAEQQRVSEIKQQVPQEFILDSSAEAQLVKTDTVNRQDITVDSFLELQDGISYTLNMGIDDAAKKVVDEMKAKNWYAVNGSYTKDNVQYRKLRHNNEYIYVVIQPVSSNTTKVTILPLKNK